MKTLLLLRHGKSSWGDVLLADHDRPLKKRGHRAAQQMGHLLAELRLVPDLVLTSTATRARDTAVLMANTAGYRGTISAIAELYHAEHLAFVELVSSVSIEAETVLVVGHNPGLEDWLMQLVGDLHEFPTAALAWIELPIGYWSELTRETRGTLRGVWRPKEVADEESSK
ncbi:MAG: histidine phosphatase family protein [Planctomycetia bacterium]|nr:histidine phosphatase family protein [Planctomycetia bacterium]